MWDFRKIGRWVKGKFGTATYDQSSTWTSTAKRDRAGVSVPYQGDDALHDAYKDFKGTLHDGGYLAKPKLKRRKRKAPRTSFRRIKNQRVFFGKYIRRLPAGQREHAKKLRTSILNRCIVEPSPSVQGFAAGMRWRTLYLHPTKGWRTRRMA